MGLVSIIFWALLFTMMIKSCTSSYANMGTVEVPYTTFKEWLAEDKIDTVNVENGKYTFTLRDGVEAVSYTHLDPHTSQLKRRSDKRKGHGARSRSGHGEGGRSGGENRPDGRPPWIALHLQ